MESEEVSLPLIHEHPMIPWNDLRKGDCCRGFEASSDGYYCKSCDYFVHKKCGDEVSEPIQHPSHTDHTLELQIKPRKYRGCDLCGRIIVNLCYRCGICDFAVDLHCAKYPPPEVIETSETHRHNLTLLKETGIEFDCDAKCGRIGFEGYPYKCHECDLTFHLDCVWNPPLEANRSLEVNHCYHSLHPLKLVIGKPPEYSDGKCRICGRRVDRSFYHCSSCKFAVDMRCVLHPPPKSLMDLKVHDHQLTLLPRLDTFTCNACGLKGDRSPYVCFQCGFMIHQDCLTLPRVININRHDHRIYRTCVLGVLYSVCGVCRQKVDWAYGGYSCHKCPSYVVHSKCATLKNVWNGKELEDVPEEETEDIEPYEVIDDNTIKHFSHEEHHLRINKVNGLIWEENKRCSACTHPVGLQSFYGCVDCDFVLHQKCAQLPKKKRHVLHNERLTLVTSKDDDFWCGACRRIFNGFRYEHGRMRFDVRCGSISEPFVHPSHPPHHPLYYIPQNEDDVEICNGCLYRRDKMLRCIEDDCRFFLCFGCATLPQVVKHRVDDHPLSLCYGEKDDASGKYWCDICETETNPETWFYTCKDQRLSLHTECVLGDFTQLMPRSKIEYLNKSYEVVLNNSVTRPFCKVCKSRCMRPIILKLLGTSDTYICSGRCLFGFCLCNLR